MRNGYVPFMKRQRHPSPLLRPILHLFLCLPLVMLLSACGKSHTSSHYAYPTSNAGTAIAASARSQLGKPYLKGGISPRNGFDCSGLVYWACAQNGVSVPRTAHEQMKIGQKVKSSALRPGDIVVFKTSWTGYHTGIYLGQGRFVHSPRPNTRVRIDSLLKEYWKEHYVTGRRVVLP